MWRFSTPRKYYVAHSYFPFLARPSGGQVGVFLLLRHKKRVINSIYWLHSHFIPLCVISLFKFSNDQWSHIKQEHGLSLQEKIILSLFNLFVRDRSWRDIKACISFFFFFFFYIFCQNILAFCKRVKMDLGRFNNSIWPELKWKKWVDEIFRINQTKKV